MTARGAQSPATARQILADAARQIAASHRDVTPAIMQATTWVVARNGRAD